MNALAVLIIALCITGYEQYMIKNSNSIPIDNKNAAHLFPAFGKDPRLSAVNPASPPVNPAPRPVNPAPRPVNPAPRPVNPAPRPISPNKNQTIDDPGLDNIGMPRDGRNHPCYRECRVGETRTCYYRFHVEWYQTMSKACKNCPRNATECGNPDCVPVNGIPRPITVVNRKMPGPSVEICQGDRVVVDVQNSLMASGTTIHWHGMHQKETPYMDGTPFVTQCPIQPESTFRYDFTPTQSGTYFWHSHIGLQRGDGTTGSLIIREPKNVSPHGNLYDNDLSEHVIVISDWINNATINLFVDHHHSSGDNRPTSILINGGGRFRFEENSTMPPLVMSAPVFEVTRGQRYRFRLINAEYLNCPVEVSVDGHDITVISTDGYDVVPTPVSALVTYAGERFDFIINANQTPDAYWIKVRGLLACETAMIRQVAVLRYKGVQAIEPASMNWNATRSGRALNVVQQGEEQNVSIPISRLRSLRADDASLKPQPDHKFFISYDMRLKNNSNFHRLPFYGVNNVDDIFRLLTPQLNHISMKLPKSPLLVSRPSSAGFCNESTVPATCQTDFCQCPHVLNVGLNSVVEIVLIDEGNFDTNHPFHLHGHSFRVVSQRKVGNNTNATYVRELDRTGRITRNLKNAPLKDTVTIPDGGYTVIRFLADNPGYWLFHCHIEFHAEIGMALVFKVGEHQDMKPVPNGFPQCGDYMGNN